MATKTRTGRRILCRDALKAVRGSFPLTTWNPATPPAILEAGISALRKTGSDHLMPLLVAVRECSISLMLVPQGCTDFRPPNRPWVVQFGDDPRPPRCALGPSGFAAKPLQRLLGAADIAIIAAYEPFPNLYEIATALTGYAQKNVVLIDTQPEFKVPWLEACQNRIRGSVFCGTVGGGLE